MPADLTVLQPTRRFTDRVDNYVKYRPSYPEEIVAFFENEFGLSASQRIADIGSGTGIFSELFLKKNYAVTCVEPNDDMRKAAERKLGVYPGFTSRNRRAEHTGLRTHSANLITVAQAFHWMEPVATKKEFLRILKPGGHTVLIWNVRNAASAFMHDHEELKQEFGIDYNAVSRSDEDAIRSFFEPAEIGMQRFPTFRSWILKASKASFYLLHISLCPGILLMKK